MKPAFQTKRLRVFRVRVRPLPGMGKRSVYLAFEQMGQLYPVAVCTVFERPVAPHYVELVEVGAMHRGQGYAKELWRGVEKHLGVRMVGDAASAEGAKLLDSIKRKRRVA